MPGSRGMQVPANVCFLPLCIFSCYKRCIFLCKGLVTVTATVRLLPTVDYLVSPKRTTICKGLITVTTTVMLVSSVGSLMICKIIIS